jgi:subtilase family serine protease
MNRKVHQAHIDPSSGTLHTDYTAGGGTPLVPYDLEKIYNIAPLYSAGISGQGTIMMVVEDTNQWNCLSTNAPPPVGGYNTCPSTSDFAVFRNTFGLGRWPSGVMKENNPGTLTTNSCNSPSTGAGYPGGSGINTDDDEATIDVEWATAGAPNATIVSAACADPSGGFGGLTAIQNTLNHPNEDGVDVISMSYGEPETETGATLNAAFNTTFQQAVTAGLGIFVSSGDALAAGADRNRTSATHGINISGWMSSPYDVSVGGLDFADTYLGETSTYWNTTNNVFYGSAKSYIMEQPWNDDCAGTLLAHYVTGSYITYGSTGFCNTSAGSSFLEVVGGSGGPSGCATGSPATREVVSGTCAGWPKPSYQSSYIGSMAGLVNDSVRDTPDVSLMAANGLWGHYYLICFSDPNNGGTACTGQPINWPGFGGTSVSSPIMASIQDLVVQHKGSRQGNPNTRYYALAATEYGPSGNASCDSTLGNGVGGSCVFYDVTIGDIDADCTALSGVLHNCYKPSGTYGVLSTDNNSYQPAYPTGPGAPFGSYPRGWDFSSGIGSVNAYNLVMAY